MLGHYEVLGVSPSCSGSELRQAYRRKALEAHPDKNPHRIKEATIEFQAIGLAYSVLKDPNSRTQYDCSMRTRGSRQSAYDSDSSETFQSAYKSGPFDMGQAHDLFREVFGSEFAEKLTGAAQQIAPHIENAAVAAANALGSFVETAAPVVNGVLGNFVETAAPVVNGVMEDARRQAISEHERRIRRAEEHLKRCTERVAEREHRVYKCKDDMAKHDAKCKANQGMLRERIIHNFLRLRDCTCIGGIGCVIIYSFWQVRARMFCKLLLIVALPIQALIISNCALCFYYSIYACHSLFERSCSDSSQSGVFREKVDDAHRCLRASCEDKQRAIQHVRQMQMELVSCRESGPSLENVVSAGLSFLFGSQRETTHHRRNSYHEENEMW